MISHERRCIFVHVPKTGGTSIEDAIWPGPRTAADLWMGFVAPHRNRYQTGGLQHLLAEQIRDAVGPATFAAYWKFAFVRNPWDKAVSQYVYLRERPDLRELLGLNERAELKTYLDRIGRVSHVQWLPQVRFLLDAVGECLVDYVGRFERFADDARHCLRHVGLPDAPLPHAKKGRRKPYPEYYDAESRSMVEVMYAADVRRFGYTFGE